MPHIKMSGGLLMRIIYAKDYDELSRKAANIVSATITLKPNCVLGLATGSTPIGMYSQLVDRYTNNEIDFRYVKTVNLDEYVGLSEDHPQSYRYYMNENLFSKVNLNKENTHLPNGLTKDLSAECVEYETLIADLGGIDLQVLGIGNNGHIGFNEPSDIFEKQTHVVTLTESTRKANARFFNSLEDVPTQAITMGIKSIMKARAILLLATGEGKKEILERALFGSITPDVPASILQMHPNVTVVADKAAIACIRNLESE